MSATARTDKPRPWGAAVLALSAFLLISMGGAIVAAPVTVPLLLLAIRRGVLTGGMRTAAVIVGGLTVAQVGWAATYLILDESQPWIWLLPLAAGAAGMVGLVRGGTPAPATP
ncbi:MAG: hypothetical protein ACRDZ7_01255 [Acidimicrobiia bacterium]